MLDALKRLEYRGYDSAGIAVLTPTLEVHKKKGEIKELLKILPEIKGNVGIGHTRWASCGKPSDENAHPFRDCSKGIAVVHNGIIENYMSLRKMLEGEGHQFSSQTDTEVIVHLLEKYYVDDMHEALRKTVETIRGTYAIAALKEGSDEIVAARKENPLVIGLGVKENFVSSDVTALLPYTNKVLYIMDGETVRINTDKVQVFDKVGDLVDRREEIVSWSAEDAQKGGFEHFMLKEIFEEPLAIHNSILGAQELVEGELLPNANFNSIKIVGCGTSFNAAMVGKYIMEEFAKIPTTLELASEYRYSPGAKESPLVILVSQSGETADTLAAAREARRRGCHTLGVTNVVGSLTDPGSGRGVLYPCRSGDRRRRHQDIHHPADRDVHHRHTHRLRQEGPQLRCHVERAVRAQVLAGGSPVRSRPHGGDRRGGSFHQGFEGHLLHREEHQLPYHAGRRPEAEGDILYPRRRVRRGGAEARAAGIAGFQDPHHSRVPLQGPHLRQDDGEHIGGGGPGLAGGVHRPGERP